MNVIDRMNRPAVVRLKIKKDGRFGKAGQVVEFSHQRATQLVESGVGEIVADKDSAPAKRGPGRPPKVRPENKSMGAA